MKTLQILGTTALLAGLSLSSGSQAPAERHAVVRAVQGGARVQGQAGGEEAQSLTVNLPIFEGDTVWTDPGGRLGLLLSDGNTLWMDGSTRLDVATLPQEASGGPRLKVRLWKGTVLLDLRVWDPAMVATVIESPSATVSPARGGRFLVEVETVDRSRVTALEGACQVTTAGGAVTLGPGEMTYADYGYPPIRPVAAEPASYRGLLDFADDQLPRRTRGVSQRYLPENLRGYAPDFDTYGSWVYTPEYGYVWRPSVLEAEWSPYMAGRWWWGPWGMTWIPYEAWGWVPFHYGRWTFVAGIGWGWIPLSVFAPAWVAWYWGDDGWLGWCPLGWDGLPYWGPCGWYSVPILHVYDPYIPRVIVHHRTPPPPRPIYPRAQGAGGAVLVNGGPRVSGPVVSPVNLPPGRVRDLADGRISRVDLRDRLLDPLPAPPSRRRSSDFLPGTGGRDRWTGPAETPGVSGNRPTRRGTAGTGTVVTDDTVRSREGRGTSTPGTGPRSGWIEPQGPPDPGREEGGAPRQREPLPPASTPSVGRSRTPVSPPAVLPAEEPSSRGGRWSQPGVPPSEERSTGRTGRSSWGRTAPPEPAPSVSPREDRGGAPQGRSSEAPRGRAEGRSAEPAPRYIPSRPSAGVETPSPPPRSGTGHRRR